MLQLTNPSSKGKGRADIKKTKKLNIGRQKRRIAERSDWRAAVPEAKVTFP